MSEEIVTTQQIDRDLAEKVMGWTPTGYTNTREDGWLFQRDGELSVWVCSSWSPSTSRDDCAEVLGRLTDEQMRAVGSDIRNRCPQFQDIVTNALMLTPAQISEAVWRATC